MSEGPHRTPEEVEREMRRMGLGYERPLQVTVAELQAQKANRTGDKNVGRKPSSTHHHNESLEQENITMPATQGHVHETKHSNDSAPANVDPLTAALEARQIIMDSTSMKREIIRAGLTATMTVALGAAVFGVVAFFSKPVAVIPDAVPLKK